MIINYNRREELKKFADDFNNILKEAEEKYKKVLFLIKQNIEATQIKTEANNETDLVTQHKSYISNIRKPQRKPSPVWVPNKIKGDYFTKFMKLPNGRDINCWDVVLAL